MAKALARAARIGRIRQTLFERYDVLNQLYLEAEDRLTKMHAPHPVFFEYAKFGVDPREPEGQEIHCLGIEKVRGKWRICHGVYFTPQEAEPNNWTPITECSAVTRVEAAEYVPDLELTIIESAAEFVPRVDAAIEELRRFVSPKPSDQIRQTLDDQSASNGHA